MDKKTPTYRVLIAKCGLDGHDRGARTISLGLRDAGLEVIYSGLHQTPEKVVNIALQEDVNAIGVSILSGAHMTIFPKIRKLMAEKGLANVLLFGGGVIPPEDAAALQAQGIGKIFSPGSSIPNIVEYLRKTLQVQEQKGANP